MIGNSYNIILYELSTQKELSVLTINEAESRLKL